MNSKMKAVVFEEYGPPDVLHLAELDKPVPRDNEVLIKVLATTATKYDCWVRSNTAPPGFGLIMRATSGRKPKQRLLGTELAGEVEAVGSGVTRFKPGDAVYGYTGMNLGAYAQYVCLPQTAVAIKPSNLSMQEAAGVLQGGLTALYFLRKGNIQPGNHVLIFGASGGVGSYAVQLASHYFGAEVTGVCSASKRAFVECLGADRVIDYRLEDFTQNGQVYDAIFDTVGKTNIRRSRKVLKDNGSYLMATFGLLTLFQLLWYSRTGKQAYEFGALKETREDLVFLRELFEAGVILPVVDHCYPLEQAAEAHRYVESGQKCGNVVLTINHNGSPGEQ